MPPPRKSTPRPNNPRSVFFSLAYLSSRFGVVPRQTLRRTANAQAFNLFPSAVDPSPPTPEPPLPASTPRILLIEDHVDTLATLTRLLTRKGYAVTPAPSGQAAREEFARGSFDLIVSDLSLSDASGLDLIAEFSATRRLPSIAMSGYGTESDIQDCKAAGFTEHLTKPLDFAHFLQTVARLARPEG